jgi:hypothetical protein
MDAGLVAAVMDRVFGTMNDVMERSNFRDDELKLMSRGFGEELHRAGLGWPYPAGVSSWAQNHCDRTDLSPAVRQFLQHAAAQTCLSKSAGGQAALEMQKA